MSFRRLRSPSTGGLGSCVLLLLVALPSCADDPAAPTPIVASLVLAGDSLIAVGASTPLQVEARDASGARIANPDLSWMALEPAVATVSAAGVVTGVAPGLTGVVASSADVADTLRFRVTTPDLTLGEAHGWIATSTGRLSLLWSGQATLFDTMGGDEGDAGRLLLTSPGRPGTLDSLALFEWLGRIEAGARPIVGHPLGGPMPDAVVAAVGADRDDGGYDAYYSVPVGSLTLTRVELPARPGLLPGEVDGHATFRAVRYQTATSGVAVATTDTVDVYVEFSAWLEHRLRARVSFATEGGPVEGSALRTAAQTYLEPSKLEAWWDADFDLAPHPWPWEAQQSFILEFPAVGGYDVRPITPDEYADATQWPPAFSVIHYRDDPRVALSVDGTLTITRWRLPTRDFYGEVEGALGTELALWDAAGEATGEAVTATATFALPILPIGAAPPVAPWGGSPLLSGLGPG